MNTPAFTLTQESLTIIWNGRTTTVRKGAPNFKALREAIMEEEWDRVPGLLTIAKSLSSWAKGRFTVQGDTVLFDGQSIPQELNRRIGEMAAKNEDPASLFNFWEKLQKNPSARSVQQLWPFLNHQGIPLTKEGNLLAYKGVNDDYTDRHTGTVDNSPGAVNEMPRNKISDDPNEGCHFGFHVGALEYAGSFGNRTVVCEVDPADVVCIPYDSSFQKMRVCKYKVIGNHNGELLSDTSHEDDPYYEELDEAAAEVQDDVPAAAKSSVPRKYQKYQKLTMSELLDYSMDDLRRYASQGLKIVGAYKIPGGKVALVAAIMKVR